jgi:hypothetical protein
MIERGEQRRVAAVTQAHPDEPTRVAGTIGEEDEVLILADDDLKAWAACVQS